MMQSNALTGVQNQGPEKERWIECSLHPAHITPFHHELTAIRFLDENAVVIHLSSCRRSGEFSHSKRRTEHVERIRENYNQYRYWDKKPTNNRNTYWPHGDHQSECEDCPRKSPDEFDYAIQRKKCRPLFQRTDSDLHPLIRRHERTHSLRD